MKVLKKSAIWIVLVIYIIVAFSFIKNRYKTQKCTAVNVVITDSLLNTLISTGDVMSMLKVKGIKCKGVPLKELDLAGIERAVTENQIIDVCYAYTEIDGKLTIEISQREPIVRIMEENGKGYYLDKDGNVLNLSYRHSPHVLVANGHLNTSIKVGSPTNILAGKNKEYEKLKEIYQLASYISKDPLWNSQIVQLYVNENEEFEMVPRIGPHLIILGTIDNYKEKFENLELLYKEGLDHTGWNIYREINLKYEGQIVCTKI